MFTSNRRSSNTVYPKTNQSLRQNDDLFQKSSRRAYHNRMFMHSWINVDPSLIIDANNDIPRETPSPLSTEIIFQDMHRNKKQKAKRKNKCMLSMCCRCLLPCCLLSLLALILLGINATLITISILKKPTTTTASFSITTTTTIMSCSLSGSTTQSPGEQGGASVLYTFDNSSDDYFGVYDAMPVNNPQYVSPGYNGRDQAISLDKNLSQYLTIANHMNFYRRSFTVEVWIYPLTVCSTDSFLDSYMDFYIFAQTNITATGQVMWFLLRNGHILTAFFGNDLTGSTMIGTKQWYHIAFTYDYTNLIQTVYVNGILDGIHINAAPCEIISGVQTIGSLIYPISSSSTGDYFHGYIDQLTILFNKTKSYEQILDDATLVAYYSMDCLSYSSQDSGPNHIDGTAIGLISDGGRVGQSYLFNSSASYFQVEGLILLGQSYRPFSFALWLRPIISVTNGGTILHVSQLNNGLGWCRQYIGLSSSGQIIAYIPGATGAIQLTGPVLIVDQWVHVAVTHSRHHGLCLYVDGLLYGQSNSFIYAPSGVPMTVTLGQTLSGSSCSGGSIQTGFYRGQIDEFYIYSRELSKNEVTMLANQ